MRESLDEAVCLLYGCAFMHPSPESGEPKHAMALLDLEYRLDNILSYVED